jgi:hypothetical protein
MKLQDRNLNIGMRGKDVAVSSFVVRGHVRKADGSPLIEAIVRAFDKDLRHEERLGESVTDGSGHYEIAYTDAQFRRAEKQNADLVVRVYDPQGNIIIDIMSFIGYNIVYLAGYNCPASCIGEIKSRPMSNRYTFLDFQIHISPKGL